MCITRADLAGLTIRLARLKPEALKKSALKNSSDFSHLKFINFTVHTAAQQQADILALQVSIAAAVRPSWGVTASQSKSLVSDTFMPPHPVCNPSSWAGSAVICNL